MSQAIVATEHEVKRILFFAEAVTLAHVARPIVLATAIENNPDYEVHVAVSARYFELYSSLNVQLHALESKSSEAFRQALAKGAPIYTAAELRGYVVADLQLLDQIKPDFVIGDFRLSLAISCPLRNIKFASISNSYWSPFADVKFPLPELPMNRIVGLTLSKLLFNAFRPLVFKLHARPLNKIRREYGLQSLGSDLRAVYSYADFVFLVDIPELSPIKTLPLDHYYLGPVNWSAIASLPDWWETLPPKRPVVYLSLGSSGDSQCLDVIVAALSDLNISVLVATAARRETNFNYNNTYVTKFLPNDVVMARAALVICNGGNPSTYQALSSGVPVIGIANNMDQHLNMQVLANTGAVEYVRSEQLNAKAIKNLVQNMLESAQYVSAAQKVANKMAHYDCSKRFQEILGNIVRAM